MNTNSNRTDLNYLHLAKKIRTFNCSVNLLTILLFLIIKLI